jgi:hypothetical protein
VALTPAALPARPMPVDRPEPESIMYITDQGWSLGVVGVSPMVRGYRQANPPV